MTDDIVAFIRARLDEDETAAVAAAHMDGMRSSWIPMFGMVVDANDGDWAVTLETVDEIAVHIARHDPARVLCGVEAKRRLVDDLLAQDHVSNDRDWYGCQSLKEGPGDGPDVPTGRPCTCGRDEDVGRRLRLIALEWSTHEDYRSEWTP